MGVPVVDTTLTWHFRLRPDVTASLASSPVTLTTATAAMGVTAPEHVVAVRELDTRSCSELGLAATVMARCGEGAGFGLQRLLRKLHRDGWLEYELHLDGVELARLRPLAHVTGPSQRPTATPRLPVQLSRFAVLRAVDGQLRMESPRSSSSVVFCDPRSVALVAALAAPMADLDAVPDVGPDVAAAMLSLLDHAGMLDHGEEQAEQRFAQWSLSDLLLHSSSRVGRRDGGYGGTYRLADRFPPLPAVAPRRTGTTIALHPPDLGAVVDASLTAVLEGRRSIRRHDPDDPISVSQLGELLYRSCRTRRVFRIEQEEAADRPYPAGGALHELEVYPLVTRCAGLEPGLWHYAASSHELELVSEPSAAVRGLIDEARFAGVMDSDPQVALLISARFGRIMWKYESVGYAIVLKNVGVLYQTLYLVATAMGLAACALGGGNSDRFAEATGLDYYTETTVGEFLLGSRMPGDSGGVA